MRRAWALAAVLLACVDSAAAQTAVPTPPPTAASSPTTALTAPSSPAQDGVHLAAGTPVAIVLAEGVSSNGRTRGDRFAIKLAAPIVVDGRTVVPAGAVGVGEVVYAEPGGAGGSPGKLVLAARYIDIGAVRVKLKAFNLSDGGESNFREMMVAAEILGPAVMFINGRNVLYPEGMRARAKLAEDVVLPLAPDAGPPPAAQTAAQPTAPAAAPATPASPSTAKPEPKT